MNAPSEQSKPGPAIELIDAVILPPLENVQWRVNAGDFWVVIGTPGAGKTDLLSIAAGLQKPTRGTHRLFGHEITQLTEDEQLKLRLQVGMVFENGGRLFAHSTVAENVALPLCYHRDCEYSETLGEVEAVLELTGLASMAQDRVTRIGRNWRQRVALARALVLRPHVLLLDNPLAGLDPRHSRWWLEFLTTLAGGHTYLEGRKLTLAITAEDLRPWAEVGRHFAVLDRNTWRVVGDRTDLANCHEPLLREIMAGEFADD